MARKRVKPPYMLHKATGQARAKIDGKDYYLGAFGSPDSRDQYDALIAEWLAQQDPKASRLTIDELAILFVQHCDEYYRKPDGRPTGEATNMRGAIRPLLSLFGSIPCRSFSCRLLKQYREKLIKVGICRRSCNRNVIRVRGMFRWAVENEYIPAQVWHELLAMKGLAAGRSAAVETEAVKPVPQERVDAVEPHISRQLWACIQLQTLTGCRPGEVLQMRACDLNMSGNVWGYRPQSHKTQHHREERVIMIGPQPGCWDARRRPSRTDWRSWTIWRTIPCPAAGRRSKKRIAADPRLEENLTSLLDARTALDPDDEETLFTDLSPRTLAEL